jgi:hypothetical protein
MSRAKHDPTVWPRNQLAHFSTPDADRIVRVIPKVISMLGFFYIGRMLTRDVDLLPAYLRVKIKKSETGAGDTNYINGRRVGGVTRGYRINPRHT